jgi:hypothetical protein
MAKVAADSLPWLSAPSTGYDLFTKPSAFVPRDGDNNTFGPKRLIATRGAEIFVGRGNEVRCADLNDLKARHPDINVQAEAAKKLGHREYKVGLYKQKTKRGGQVLTNEYRSLTCLRLISRLDSWKSLGMNYSSLSWEKRKSPFVYCLERGS